MDLDEQIEFVSEYVQRSAVGVVLPHVLASLRELKRLREAIRRHRDYHETKEPQWIIGEDYKLWAALKESHDGQ